MDEIQSQAKLSQEFRSNYIKHRQPTLFGTIVSLKHAKAVGSKKREESSNTSQKMNAISSWKIILISTSSLAGISLSHIEYLRLLTEDQILQGKPFWLNTLISFGEILVLRGRIRISIMELISSWLLSEMNMDLMLLYVQSQCLCKESQLSQI